MAQASAVEIDRLRTLATNDRNAIEAAGPETLKLGMNCFPRGACGDATPLLGTYLRAEGCGSFFYTVGYRADADHPDAMPHSHAWLQRSDLVVDITADQFAEIAERVIVAEPSPWHTTLTGIAQRHVADIGIYDPYTVERLRAAYARIMRYV